MNVTESRAAQTVIEWLAAVRLVETGPAAPADIELVAAVGVLAEQSHRTLQAGCRRQDAIEAVTAAITDSTAPEVPAPTPAGGAR